MKSTLPILACLAATGWMSAVRAQAPAGNAAPAGATTEAASIPSGESLVDRVIDAVAAQASVGAKLRHRVELAGRPLIGTGFYLQQGRGADRAFRWEMDLRTTLSATRHWQVCDGNQLWILQEQGGHTHLSRIDMARLRAARHKSNGSPPPEPSLLALGGLPKLLIRLQDAFVFDRVSEGGLDDLRVWSIEGGWHPARLKNLLPDQQETIDSGGTVDLSRLADNLPHRVVLHVGCDDLFPYRIEYWRHESAPEDEDAPGRDVLVTVMELYEVQLGARIDPSRFVFRPGELTPNDRTQEFLDRLGLEDPAPQEAKRRLRSPL